MNESSFNDKSIADLNSFAQDVLIKNQNSSQTSLSEVQPQQSLSAAAEDVLLEEPSMRINLQQLSKLINNKENSSPQKILKDLSKGSKNIGNAYPEVLSQLSSLKSQLVTEENSSTTKSLLRDDVIKSSETSKNDGERLLSEMASLTQKLKLIERECSELETQYMSAESEAKAVEEHLKQQEARCQEESGKLKTIQKGKNGNYQKQITKFLLLFLVIELVLFAVMLQKFRVNQLMNDWLLYNYNTDQQTIFE